MSYIISIHYCNVYTYENSIAVIYVSAILQLHNLFVKFFNLHHGIIYVLLVLSNIGIMTMFSFVLLYVPQFL